MNSSAGRRQSLSGLRNLGGVQISLITVKVQTWLNTKKVSEKVRKAWWLLITGYKGRIESRRQWLRLRHILFINLVKLKFALKLKFSVVQFRVCICNLRSCSSTAAVNNKNWRLINTTQLFFCQAYAVSCVLSRGEQVG